MRFSDLVGVDNRPEHAMAVEHAAVDTDSYLTELTADPRNNGFVTGLVDRRRGKRMTASRRGFIRGTIAAAAATTAVSAASLFGPARKVEAQSGVVGTYPRRILQYCPPYNSGDNCQPGCGSSPICTDCCGSDGYFRNDPGNGYTLYAGGCGDGDIADGWLWRFKGKCGNCAEIEYRCSDGYVQTDTGPAPFICRYVTDCVPLADGEAPGEALADAARATNWRPAGALELAVDQGNGVRINGWIADGSGVPLDMLIRANNRIVHLGTASLPRPDIPASRRGSSANVGFGVSFGLEPGEYELCVDALRRHPELDDRLRPTQRRFGRLRPGQRFKRIGLNTHSPIIRCRRHCFRQHRCRYFCGCADTESGRVAGSGISQRVSDIWGIAGCASERRCDRVRLRLGWRPRYRRRCLHRGSCRWRVRQCHPDRSSARRRQCCFRWPSVQHRLCGVVPSASRSVAGLRGCGQPRRRPPSTVGLSRDGEHR